MGHLSTHVLDTAQGRPAPNVSIDLHILGVEGSWKHIKQVTTNADGRTDQPILAGDQFRVGTYMLTFHIGSYFKAAGLITTERPFLDLVPLRFSIADHDGRYHVPLLATPWSYSTYRGS
jgi:5-hydroxyisourate hydrolase